MNLPTPRLRIELAQQQVTECRAAYEDVKAECLTPRSVQPSDAMCDAWAARVRMAGERMLAAEQALDAAWAAIGLGAAQPDPAQLTIEAA